MTKTMKGELGNPKLADLRDALLHERQRVDHLLTQVEQALMGREAEANPKSGTTGTLPPATAARFSPLDKLKGVLAATTDLRVANGNLSADRMAKLYGVPLSQLAEWLGRSKQAVSKTPDADSLQDALGFFERAARLRMITKDDGEFRKWLRTPHELLDNAPPLELLAKGEWQALVDYVEDILTGTPG
jgi:hypothetical protein